MADEQETIAPVALETPASAPEATTTPEAVEPEPVNLDAPEQETVTEPEPTEPELETIEIEWDDGKKYKIPKAIEAGVLKNKDYTTKSQENAALRKALEEREAGIEERYKASDEYLDLKADLRTLDKQLEAYGKLTQEDWDAHHATDPGGTERAWRNFQLLKDQRGQLAETLKTKDGERTAKQQQEIAKRAQETREAAAKIIPGWTPETADKTITELVQFAQSYEIPDQVLLNNWSPQLLKLLHRAQLGENLLTKQATAPKLPTSQPKPLETVNGTKSAPTSGDLAALDMEAYAAARRKGVGGKPAF